MRDRLKRVRRLADIRANHPEGAMAVARAAIDAHEWQEARNALGGPMRANPSERVCLLMAEIEEGEHGDEGRVRAWLTRALSAPRDPVWTADGQVFDRWAPVSPVTGRLDAFEWRVAAERLPPRLAMEIGGEAADQEPATRDLSPPSIQASSAAPTVASLIRPAPGPSRGGQGSTGGPLAGAQAAGPRPMARAPDDPGPVRPEEEDDGHGGVSVFHPGRTA